MDKNDPRREPSDEELKEVNEHWQEPDELNEYVREPNDPDGVVAAEEHEREQAAQPNQPPPQRTKRKRRWPLAVLILLIIVAAAVGAYWFGNRQASAPAPKPNNTQQAKKAPATQTPTATQPYHSTTFNIGFNYPKTWKVAETPSKLTVTSPSVQLPMVDGTQVASHVLITIQNKQTTIAGYPATGAIAELSSSKLTYKQPTSIQRAQTYLSYLGYVKTNGLDALYITGDNGYQQGQTVPMSDVVASDPLIGVTFVTCSTADCATGTPTPITLLATRWQSTPSSTDVNNLLESITLD